jgi:molybdopterin molybdotransferase
VVAVEKALEVVLGLAAQKARPDRMASELVPLAECPNRILREDIVADSDYPRFDKAIRDGFAVRSEDVAEVPAVLRVAGESRAGLAAPIDVREKTCCEIMTGAPLPHGANAVVMVEHTERVSVETVRVLRSVREGEGLLRRAAELRQGEKVLESGRKIQIADIGTLASVGRSEVRVSRKPRVAILATGDELVEVNQAPDPGQIRNSNSYTLYAQVVEAGAEPVLLGIGRDNLEDLRTRIGQALEHDIALVSGGVSMGKYDFVEAVFAEFGIEVLFDSVAMKPGKPTVFGHRRDTFVFGLPGNPVSTIVAFHMFVRPLILSLLKAANIQSKTVKAKMEAPARRDSARAAIVPALVRFDGESFRIKTAPWKGSSDLSALSRANALIVIPQGDGVLETGEWAEFIPLE